MRSIFIYAVAILCTFATTSATNPKSKGNYIIKLKPKVNQARLINYINVANSVNTDKVANVKHRYIPEFFNGFAGEFNQAFLEDFKKQHQQDIEYIEEDGIMTIVHGNEMIANKKEQATGAPWGIVRVSQRKANSTTSYLYPEAAGKGANVFVVDTGISITHPEFEGRATFDANFVPKEANDDLNGHGTHCAGTIGGKTFGVAKEVLIHAVKVLDRRGSGSVSSVISGIQFVSNNTLPNRIISMSLGGGKSTAINDAVNAAVGAGVTVIVAAGNENGDACSKSPASAEKAFAVGAIDINENKASFSNYGPCVSGWAPGVNTLSAWLKNTTNSISGTSMACPHVAGVAAIYVSQMNSKFQPTDIYQALKDHSSPSKDNRTVVYNDLNDSLFKHK